MAINVKKISRDLGDRPTGSTAQNEVIIGLDTNCFLWIDLGEERMRFTIDQAETIRRLLGSAIRDAKKFQKIQRAT